MRTGSTETQSLLPRRSFSPLTVSVFLAAIGVAALLPPAAQAQVAFRGALTTWAGGLSAPNGVATDLLGNVFVTNLTQTGVAEFPAGGGAPVVLGSGLNFPQGIAVDQSGNIFVADTFNNAVKEILAIGGYSTINTIGSGFSQPFGVAVDAYGDVFVADTGNAQVKELLVVGSGATAIYTNLGPIGGGYSFSRPEGIAVDGNGNVFVADRGKNAIVELMAGNYTTAVTVGSGLTSPRSVTVDVPGNIYVTDGNTLKEITAGSGFSTVLNEISAFNSPSGLALDPYGNILIADENNGRIAQWSRLSANLGTQAIGASTMPATVTFDVAAETTVSKVGILTLGAANKDFVDAGASNCAGQTFAMATACTVNVKMNPLAPGSRHGAVVLYDGGGNVLSSVPLFGVGTGPQASYQPGTPSFTNTPFVALNVVADGNGNVFVDGNYKLLEYPASGGAPIDLSAGFTFPQQMAVDGAGNLFVLDYSQPLGGQTALKELTAASGYKTVNVLSTSFKIPSGLVLDGSGNAFVSDMGTGYVLELMASRGYSGSFAIATGLRTPQALAMDGNDNLYVVDTNANAAYEYLASSSYITQRTLTTSLSYPMGIAADPSGNVYISNSTGAYGTWLIELSPADGYTTVKSLPNTTTPYGLALDAQGNLLVADGFANRVVKMDFADVPSVSFPSATMLGFQDTTDGAETVTVMNRGNRPLVFGASTTGSNPSYAANFPENLSDASLCAANLSLAAGATCDLSMNFKPIGVGTNTGIVTVTDNSMNAAGTVRSINVRGIGILDATKTSLTATPTAVGIGFPVTLTAAVTSTAPTPTGTVVFLVDKVQAAQTTLASGIASVAISIPAGVHSVTATYAGTQTYAQSSSAAVTVTVANMKMIVYGGSGQSTPYGSTFASPLSVALMNSTGQPVAGQTITFIGKGVNLSSATAVTDGNGIASVTATAVTIGSESVLADFNSDAGAQFALTGTKAPLTFAATSVNVPIGQPIQRFKYSLSGFVNGDGSSAFSGIPVEATTATQTNTAGTYPITITQGTLMSTNYSFVFAPGTLTVVAPASAATIAPIAGNAQSAVVGTLFSAPLTVIVKDSTGHPVAGTAVTFLGNGLRISPTSVLTNGSGIAFATAVPTTTGTVTATVTASGVSTTFTETGK